MRVASRLATNSKLLCRHHHLLKTFYTGPTGWADRQLPDGTAQWTAPTGHTCATKPGGSSFFPALGAPTAGMTSRTSLRHRMRVAA
ncbi:hypothetical protein [Mycobacterium sp.]|uniref:hypothetical protein n=1 Tax=Mycobacterium sp. TaxID=1785 RepID=UPI0031E139ED